MFREYERTGYVWEQYDVAGGKEGMCWGQENGVRVRVNVVE